MISPRLQLLQRQLAKSIVKDPEERGEPDHKSILSVVESCQAEIKRVLADAEAIVADAQAKCDKMECDMADMQKAHKQECDDMQCQMNDKESAAEEKMGSMMAGHSKTVQQLQDQIAGLQKALSTEQQARGKAETECKTMRMMCDNLEKIINKLQTAKAPAPAIMAPARGPMPVLKTEVTQRDANGRILSFITKPAT